MNCDERAELWLLYAADLVEPAEQDELRSHLAAGCPRCAGSLAEAHAVLTQLPLALDPVAPPPELKERLLARVAASPRVAGRERTARVRV
ncbi:MAG TPA: hypothetical protein VJS92_00745, partial [Candidatus Polarisedimenticolaceae bacterium]|nr:hypothetical protein [Candidatus Polarisedimenticolaceae bacterium]